MATPRDAARVPVPGPHGRSILNCALGSCAPQIKQAKEDMQNNYIPVLTARNVPYEGEALRALGLSLLVLTRSPDS